MVFSPDPPGPRTDRLGRPLTDLRLSVTDQCSFRCPYCLPAERFPANHPWLSADRLLTFDHWLTAVGALRRLGLQRVKITGGEPLQRPGLEALIGALKDRWPDLGVSLVTNGLHLLPLVPRLRAAGLDGVTVSLDAVDPQVYGDMTGTGRRIGPVLEAIETVRQTWGRAKVNTVLVRGRNEGQVEPLVDRFRRPGFTLRFIEYMDVGTLNGWNRDQVVSGAEVRARALASVGVALVPVEATHPGETARRWAWADGQGELGFINPVTEPFCSSCSRVRLGPDGTLRTCLFSPRGHEMGSLIRLGDEEALAAEVSRIWEGRKDRASEERGEGTRGPRPEMFAVGG